MVKCSTLPYLCIIFLIRCLVCKYFIKIIILLYKNNVALLWLGQHLWNSAHEAEAGAVNLYLLAQLLLWRMSILEPHFRSKLITFFDIIVNLHGIWLTMKAFIYSLQKLFLTGQSYSTKLFLFPNLYLLYILNLGSWSRSYTQRTKHSGPKAFLPVCRMVALG